MFKVPERYRFTDKNSPIYSDESYGNNGVFFVNDKRLKNTLKIIASDGLAWEHVSISAANRCPVWREMNFIKDLFWGEDDCVVQFHPPKSDYVNYHPNVLHLWRSIEYEIPRPPSFMVGPSVNEQEKL